MRIVVPGLTPAKHALTKHTSDMIAEGAIQNVHFASNFLSDTKGDIGLGLNKLLTQFLRLREYDSGTMCIENRDGTSLMDLLVKALNTNYINFKAPFAQVNMNPTTDSYVMFRGWDGSNYFNAAQLDISGFKILNGTLCPYRQYVAPAGVDYVELTNLDIKTHRCYVLMFVVRNPTGSGSGYNIYVNGDYDPNSYFRQELVANGTGVSATRTNGTRISYATAGNRTATLCWIWLDPDGYFRCLAEAVKYTASAMDISFTGITRVVTASNITSIRITTDVSGAIGTGSQFMLFRLGG